MYKYDLHVHSKECSRCAVSTVKQMIDAYISKGFSGFVLTNHFITGNTVVDRTKPWEEKMAAYRDALENAREYAVSKNFDLLFGIEHNYGKGREVLIYGIDYNFLFENSDMIDIPLEELAQRVHKTGGFIAHAHPFRVRGYIDSNAPKCLELCDGIEVYNAANYDDENKKATDLNEELKLTAISGSDSHDSFSEFIGEAGIAVTQRIKNEQQLVDILKKGDYQLIINGKIQNNK